VKNHPAAEKLVNALSDAVDACAELAEAHASCDCVCCEQAAGLSYTIAAFRDCFECAIIPTPRMMRRLRAVRPHTNGHARVRA